MKLQPLILSLALLLTQCTPHLSKQDQLASITIIDQNQFAETITSTDRLEQYKQVDFTKNQPYQKVLRVYDRDKAGNMHSILTSYHPNGQIKQHLEALNNQAQGQYQEWFPNGQKHLEANLVGGEADLTSSAEDSWLFDGTSKAWDEEGHLIAALEYSKGVLEGVSHHYHPNGRLWKKMPFSHNKMHGSHEVYLENGLCLQTSHFVNGIKEGPTIRFWPNKMVATEEMYRNNLLFHGRYYDQKGTLVAQVNNGKGERVLFTESQVVERQEIKEGIQEGKVEILNNHGEVVHSHHIKNGLKHGEEIAFYETKLPSQKPRPQLSLHWFEGKVQGTARTWYDNGTPQSHREMSNNKKNGLLTTWYEDGSLMMIEDYENDILIKGEYFKRGQKAVHTQVWEGNGIATLFDSKGNFLQKVTYHNGRPQG